MVKLFFGFLSGIVLGFMYGTGEPNKAAVITAKAIKAMFLTFFQ